MPTAPERRLRLVVSQAQPPDALDREWASAERAYPHLSKPICLMTIHYPTVAEDAYQRYPFFRTTASEQTMLFDRSMPGAVRWHGSAADRWWAR